MSLYRRQHNARGQAMLEYSIVTHALLLLGGVALWPIISQMFQALNTFYDSVYAVIETAAL